MDNLNQMSDLACDVIFDSNENFEPALSSCCCCCTAATSETDDA